MSDVLTVEIKGQRELVKKLQNYTGALSNLRKVTVAIGQGMVDFYSTVPFVSGGGVYGDKWQELNPSYRKWKSKNYPGKGILVASGEMQAGFTYVADRQSVRISNPVEHFEKHQLGDGVPQRVMMKLDKKRQEDAADILRESLIKMFKGF